MLCKHLRANLIKYNKVNCTTLFRLVYNAYPNIARQICESMLTCTCCLIGFSPCLKTFYPVWRLELHECITTDI